MDRSRRGGAKQERSPSAPPVPASSRLTVRKRNRRKPASLWSRVPRPPVILDACGRALRRSLPALAALVVITGVGAGAYFGYRFVTTSERFAIAEIEIQGASRLSPADVRAALPVQVGENIFTASLDDVTTALRGNPWIATAAAHRVLPDTLVVEITEHVPAGIVQLGTELYLVDAAGHPFKRAQLEADDGKDLPIITGLDRGHFQRDPRDAADLVLRALDALTRWRANALRPAIGEVHVDVHHALTLRTYEHGAAIQLGALATELHDRLATFDVVWADLTDAERDRVRTLHLDARSDHVTVAFAKD